MSNLIDKEKLNEILKTHKTEEELFGPNGPFKQMVKQVVEAALNAELDDQLETSRKSKPQNKRNGSSSKTRIQIRSATRPLS